MGGDEFEPNGVSPQDDDDKWWQPPSQRHVSNGLPQVPIDARETAAMPSVYYTSDGTQPPPSPPPFRPNTHKRRRRLLAALALMVLVALVGGGTLAWARLFSGTAQHSAPPPPPCPTGSLCQVSKAYLGDYTGQKFDAMAGLVSSAALKRLGTPAILGGAYTNAQSYIVNRTQAILAESQIYAITATAGPVAQQSATRATVPVMLTYKSLRVGQFTQNVTLPLVHEGSAWRVDWTPGLIFSKLDDASDPNYQRKVHLFPLDAPRGTIFDKDGNVLAKDDTVYVVGVVPGQLTNTPQTLATLGASIDMTASQISAQISGQPASSFVALRTMPPQLMAQIGPTINALPGVHEQTSTGRVYPYGTEAAAVTGYVSIVTADDLKHDTAHVYGQGDYIGRAGVEGWGEQYLRATPGGNLDIVTQNTNGTYDDQTAVRIASRAAVPGDDIHTTISLAAQRAAQQALAQQDGHKGGTFALDPTTGAVLAIGSYPIYDPNDFSLGFTHNELARFQQLDHPYLNRALDEAQPIGSAFKLVTLSAGLQNGISPDQTFTCTGTYQVPGENHVRHDDKPDGHGTLNAPTALAPSCDVVFWTIAVKLNSQNPNLLPQMARSFGYGTAPNIAGISPGEVSAGIVPDPQYLKQHKNATWTATDAANLGIGQGFFEATPAQVALASAAIADSGTRMQPRLVSSVVSATNTTIESYAPDKLPDLAVSHDNLTTIQAAMLGPIYAANGTTTTQFVNFPIRVAGKTGTAESGQPKPHGWFAAYAPASALSGPPVTPQIAIGALEEYSDFGERYAVPVARAVILAYLRPGS